MRARPATLLVLAAAVCSHAAAAADPPLARLLHVDAGDHDREALPIFVELPAELNAVEQVELRALDGTHALPIQRLPGDPARAVFVLREPLAAGDSRTYRLEPSAPVDPPANDAAPVVRCRRADTGLRVELHGRTILKYNDVLVEPPAGIEGTFRRSGHIHPVLTPAGRVVTEEFPADHPHQHGIFNAWVNTTFEGRPVDFWNQKDETGLIEHVRIEGTSDGGVFAQVDTELEHSDLTDPDGPQPVLSERMRIRAYNTPRGHLFDVESRQVCVAESPLVINEYHYGGMAWRGAAGWLGQPEHDFLTSEGRTRANGNHSRPDWVAAHGLVDGALCAIVVFGHPGNFRHPQPVRLHPDKPYLVFTPPVLGEFSIEPGDEYVARYRYLVHDGPVDPDWYDRVWRDIANPPVVRIVAENTESPTRG